MMQADADACFAAGRNEKALHDATVIGDTRRLRARDMQ